METPEKISFSYDGRFFLSLMETSLSVEPCLSRGVESKVLSECIGHTCKESDMRHANKGYVPRSCR